MLEKASSSVCEGLQAVCRPSVFAAEQQCTSCPTWSRMHRHERFDVCLSRFFPEWATSCLCACLLPTFVKPSDQYSCCRYLPAAYCGQTSTVPVLRVLCCLSLGKEQSVRIQSSGGLNDDQISQMVKDAEMYAEKDKERKELIDVSK